MSVVISSFDSSIYNLLCILCLGIGIGILVGFVSGFYFAKRVGKVALKKVTPVIITEITVTQWGCKFHVDKLCPGLLTATTAGRRMQCLRCCPNGLLINTSV